MTPRVVEPPTGDSVDAERTAAVAGVLLAAGTSSRFGEENKLLATVEGSFVVRRAAASLLDSPVDPVVVVLGHEAERVRPALADLPVEFVANPAFRNGQSTSVSAGVEAIADRADAAVFALGDMPWVDPDTVGALVTAYVAGEGNALAAAHDGERGNPVLFDGRYFDALADLEGDVGGREILRQTGTLVETGDPGVRRDIDRRADLPDDEN